MFFFILINPLSYLLAFEQTSAAVIVPLPHSNMRDGRRPRPPPGGLSHTHFLLSFHTDNSGKIIQVEKVRRPTVSFAELMSERRAAWSQRASPRQYLSQPSQCVATRVDTGGNYSAAVLSLHLAKMNRRVPFKCDITERKKETTTFNFLWVWAGLTPFKMKR